jgi:hypothetical protein
MVQRGFHANLCRCFLDRERADLLEAVFAGLWHLPNRGCALDSKGLYPWLARCEAVAALNSNKSILLPSPSSLHLGVFKDAKC